MGYYLAEYITMHKNPFPKSSDPKEKRRFYRVDTSLLVDYEVVSEKEVPPKKKSIAKNLSKSGLSLDLPESFPRGTTLKIKIALPTTREDHPVAALVKVAWAESSQTKNIYDTGVYFVGITPQDNRKLQEYISLFCQ